MFVYILKDAIHSTHGKGKEKSSSKSSWQGYVCYPKDGIQENPKNHDSNRTHVVSDPNKTIVWLGQSAYLIIRNPHYFAPAGKPPVRFG